METDAKESTGQGARQDVPAVPREVYIPREDATPEKESASLAAVYAFILERYEQKQMATERDAEANTTRLERTNKSGGDYPTGEGSF